jgi:hypothetical protein
MESKQDSHGFLDLVYFCIYWHLNQNLRAVYSEPHFLLYYPIRHMSRQFFQQVPMALFLAQMRQMIPELVKFQLKIQNICHQNSTIMLYAQIVPPEQKLALPSRLQLCPHARQEPMAFYLLTLLH